ncbi:MAG TPA: class I SAM-dependent methyltransferase [Candidatus Saccharimonadales bacterium]|nr:class I SAM-dependent methyltransferase [Candidatus Saccharimonadales bacterium]
MAWIEPEVDPSLVPPEALNFVGGGNFQEIGREFKDHFVRLGGLQPHERVLDVGCGIGRMAIPLTTYLRPPGEYHGFDIVPHGIAWCQQRITARFPHFRFVHANLFNRSYNPDGPIQPKDFRFPYPDRYFDFAFLTSVFTHMLPEDLEHYLAEIERVLRPGGRSLITWFLLNAESGRHLAEGSSALAFKYEVEGCLSTHDDKPEEAIAYPEEVVRGLYDRHGFDVLEPVRWGSWCGRKEFLSFQDVVLANRRAD